MATFKAVDAIEVRIWGTRVGAAALDPSLGCYAFEYDRAWRAKNVELAPFTLPVSATPPLFVFPGLSRETYMGLPGMLSDALPDHFGNQLIDAWMARRGIAPGQVTALDRLAYMGKRGMGALEFRPARGGSKAATTPIQLATLVEAARRAIRGELSTDNTAAEAMSRIISVGTSAGGARAKAVLGWNRQTNALVSGQFDLPEGYEHWLLKFDGMGEDGALGPSQKYGRIEYAYSRMARAAGVEMSQCQLLEENGRAHFMTRRFDRDGNRKIHVQSLCAMRHMDYRLIETHAYESLFLTARELGLGDAAMTQLFRRMAFNVASRNQDDHPKNFAFMLEEGGQWRLAPAYDLTFACNPDSLWNKAHLMSVNGKFDGITRADLLTIADRHSIAHARPAIEDTNAAVENWPEYAQAAGIGADEAQRIGRLHAGLR